MATRNQVSRRIVFFRIDIGRSGKALIPFDAPKALADLAKLEPIDRYIERTDQPWLFGIVDSAKHKYMRLAGSRRRDLPLTDRLAMVDRLPIGEDQGVTELSHIVFFPDNIVGADFNWYAPRTSSLSTYLLELGIAKQCRLGALLRGDTAAKLRNTGGLTFLKIKARTEKASLLEEAEPTLGRSFRQAAKSAGADWIDIELRADQRHGDEDESPSILSDLVTRFARELRKKDIDDVITTFKIKTIEGEVLDLLHEKFIIDEQVVKEDDRSRALNTDSAYAAIERAFAKNEAALSQAEAVFTS